VQERKRQQKHQNRVRSAEQSAPYAPAVVKKRLTEAQAAAATEEASANLDSLARLLQDAPLEPLRPQHISKAVATNDVFAVPEHMKKGSKMPKARVRNRNRKVLTLDEFQAVTPAPPSIPAHAQYVSYADMEAKRPAAGSSTSGAAAATSVDWPQVGAPAAACAASGNVRTADTSQAYAHRAGLGHHNVDLDGEEEPGRQPEGLAGELDHSDIIWPREVLEISDDDDEDGDGDGHNDRAAGAAASNVPRGLPYPRPARPIGRSAIRAQPDQPEGQPERRYANPLAGDELDADMVLDPELAEIGEMYQHELGVLAYGAPGGNAAAAASTSVETGTFDNTTQEFAPAGAAAGLSASPVLYNRGLLAGSGLPSSVSKLPSPRGRQNLLSRLHDRFDMVVAEVEVLPPSDQHRGTSSLLMTGFSEVVVAEELERIFAEYGNVSATTLLSLKQGPCALLEFEDVPTAKAAKTLRSGKLLFGNIVHLHFTKDPPPMPSAEDLMMRATDQDLRALWSGVWSFME